MAAFPPESGLSMQGLREFFVARFPELLELLEYKLPNEVLRGILGDPATVFFGGPEWKSVADDVGRIPEQERVPFVLSLFMIVLTDQALYTYFPGEYGEWRRATNYPKFGWSGFGAHNANPLLILDAPAKTQLLDPDQLISSMEVFARFLVSETRSYFHRTLPTVDVDRYFECIMGDDAYVRSTDPVSSAFKSSLKRALQLPKIS